MNFLKYLIAIFSLIVLSACGGGGGNPGTPSGGAPPTANAPPSLFTTAPASLTVGVGSAQAFNIAGGTSPYTAVSNNAAIAIAGVNGSQLTLGGVTAGMAEITIRDAAGAAVIVNMIVSSGPVRPLYTTATSSITIAPGVSGAQTYQVGGGAGPYTATSSNVSIASAVLTGDVLKVTGLTAGSTSIVILDSVGATVSIAVTVPTVSNLALFTTAPSSVTVAIGASPAYSVGGGAAPYTATSSSLSVATVTLAGSSLTVNGISAGSANVVVRDSAGASVTVAVTVPTTATVALFTTAPSSVTVAIGASPAYSVGGGTAPYTAASSSTSVATVSLVGSSLTVNGISAGSASIVVRDSAGASVTVAVTVPTTATVALFTTAPSSVTVAIGASPAYSVGGGTAPYTATSDKANVATVTLVGSSLTVTGVAVGSASIVVRDSVGASVTVIVNVGTTALAVTPSNATGIINDVLIATITGGTPPFRASVGNVLVASASVQNQNELKITLLQVGQTIVTVLDANNQSIAYSLTSNAATPGIRLSPDAITVSENDTQPILFTVYGAAPGAMNVFSSDLTLLSATLLNQTVTLTTGTNDNRCVAGDTPVTITVVDSTRATGVATVTIKDNGACP